tara:strand:+ start:1915 stop:2100 length:186 start_codon:yes stop_codon:yes gene_type:complete
MKEGPMKEHFERDDAGIIKAVFITYRKKNGSLVKETSERRFYGDGDYTDSYIDEPLASLGD